MAKLIKLEFKKRDVKLKDIPSFYQELISNKITVGIHKDQDYRFDGKNNVDLAYINEFGLGHVPPRPFIRLYLYPEIVNQIGKEYASEYNIQLKNGIKGIKNSEKNILKRTGMKSSEKMCDIIASRSVLEPNKPKTIELKGFDYPLVETGALFKAIRYKVEQR